ncbi:MAG: aminopeptidase P family protein [Gemmatimonadaceae bacterium]
MRLTNSLILVSALAVPATAQLPAADHAAKRAVVMEALTADGIIIVEGSGTPPREDQTFMQSRDFQALTGIMQPGSALVLWKKGGVTGQRIVVPPKPAYAWEGEQIGPVEAEKMTGIPSLPSTALPALLDSLGAKSSKVYLLAQDAGWPGLSRALTMSLGDSGIIKRNPFAGRGGGRGGAQPAPAPTDDYMGILRAMTQARAKKTDAEVAILKRAAEISAEGHKAAMRMAYAGVNESEIRGVFEGTIFRLGAERIGYPSIVGTGANATFLHYSADTMRSKAGDVVVMDAAALVNGYSADVTRTFPVSGKFSPEQRVIYEAVLAAQSAAAATVKPGSSMMVANGAANAELWKGLIKAGLADAVGATYTDAGGRAIPQLSLFYFHGLGHGIGLSVHDPTYTDNGAFVRNSIFTIEPGLYVRPMSLEMVPDIPANAEYRARLAKALPKYIGIGTRIEDDFVVTETGGQCLSCAAPRTIAEVEAIAGKSPIRLTH